MTQFDSQSQVHSTLNANKAVAFGHSAAQSENEQTQDNK